MTTDLCRTSRKPRLAQRAVGRERLDAEPRCHRNEKRLGVGLQVVKDGDVEGVPSETG